MQLPALRLIVVMGTVLAGAASAAGTQREAPDDAEAISRWAAPPYWTPPSPGLEAHSGGRHALAGGPTALPFIALFPCRLVDTRAPAFPAPLGGGFLPEATVRSYTLTGVCNLPAGAKAISLNATVTNPTASGFLVLWPKGGAFPPVSTLNFLAGQTIVNAAVVPLSTDGGISIALGGSGGDVILDTNGYYADVPSVTSLNTQTGDVTLTAGTNVTITPGTGTLTIAATGGGGGPPTGPAGGSLSGTYPNPGIAANAVGAGQIAVGAVGSTQLATGAVGTSQLAAGAVTDAKVASGISYAKLTGAPASLPPSGPAAGSLSGTYPNPGIADAAVTDAKIASVSWGKVTGAPGFVLKAGDTMTGSLTVSPGNVYLEGSSASTGSIYKNGVPFLHDFGTWNTFVGVSAGNFTMTGGFNTAAGSAALFYNTTGTSNTAEGFFALRSNTTGSYNTAAGYVALFSNTTGDNNTASGYASLYLNTTGVGNTAAGSGALRSNTTGSSNTASGYDALFWNTTGYDNTVSGYDALHNNTTGYQNTASGRGALYNTTTGYANTAKGYGALSSNTTGFQNTALGDNAGNRSAASTGYGGGPITYVPLTTGNYNTFLGRGTGATSNNVYNCTAVGIDAYCDGNDQVRLGNYWVGSIGGKVGWSALSDARAKRDIRDLSVGLDFVLGLRPVEYRLKVGNGRTDMGFLAQDVEALLGRGYNVVTAGGDPDRTLSLRYTDLIAPLVKAIQEQQALLDARNARIDELDRRLEARDARIDELGRRLAALEERAASRQESRGPSDRRTGPAPAP